MATYPTTDSIRRRLRPIRSDSAPMNGIRKTNTARHAVPIHTADALRSAVPHLKAVLGREVRMKYTPDLVFREDPAVKRGERVEEIIRQLRTEGE